jgi:hypothetical protein
VAGLPPPPVADADGIRRLQDALSAARFDASRVGDALMVEGPNLTPSPALVPALLRSLGQSQIGRAHV